MAERWMRAHATLPPASPSPGALRMHPFDRYSALVLLGTLLAPGVRAGAVMPPDGGILPWEVDSSLVGGSVVCPNWSEQRGGSIDTSASYRIWTYRKPCQVEARETWGLVEGQWHLGIAERFHHEAGSNRMLSMSVDTWERPVPGLPRTVLSSTDSTRYFWRDGALDSMWRRQWQNASEGDPARIRIKTTRFPWLNGLPVARHEETTGEIEGCVRDANWFATFRHDTLVEMVDTVFHRTEQGASCWTGPDIEKTIWSYRPDTVETLVRTWSDASARWTTALARFIVLRPDGQMVRQIISYPDSLTPGWWLVRGELDLVLSWGFDMQGRQSGLQVDGYFGTIRQAFHYDEPPSISVQSLPARPRIGSPRVVGRRVRFELSRPTSVSVSLFAPDGRAISLARNLPLAPGPRSLALPVDLPRGVWIVRVEGDGGAARGAVDQRGALSSCWTPGNRAGCDPVPRRKAKIPRRRRAAGPGSPGRADPAG